MRDFGKVAPSFWTGETGMALRGMGRDEQLLALFLITAPCANMIGLYHLPLPVIVHYLGWNEKGVREALRRLAEAGFCQYDFRRELVWVPKMAEHQIGPTLHPRDKRATAVQRLCEPLRKTPFFRLFHERYHAAYHLPPLAEAGQGDEAEAAAPAGDVTAAVEPKKAPPREPPKARPRDDLFDAVAEVTGADPRASGSHIGKVCAALRKAEPPYTPDEVRALPTAIRANGLSFTLTIGSIEKYIGWTRRKPAGGDHGNADRGHRLVSPEGKYAGVGTTVGAEAAADEGADALLAAGEAARA